MRHFNSGVKRDESPESHYFRPFDRGVWNGWSRGVGATRASQLSRAVGANPGLIRTSHNPPNDVAHAPTSAVSRRLFSTHSSGGGTAFGARASPAAAQGRSGRPPAGRPAAVRPRQAPLCRSGFWKVATRRGVRAPHPCPKSLVRNAQRPLKPPAGRKASTPAANTSPPPRPRRTQTSELGSWSFRKSPMPGSTEELAQNKVRRRAVPGPGLEVCGTPFALPLAARGGSRRQVTGLQTVDWLL